MKTSDLQSMRGEMRMAKLFRPAILLAASLGWLGLNPAKAWAQTIERMELGASYNVVRSNAPPGGCGCFTMNGGSGWFGYSLDRNWAVVGEVGSEHASNIDGTAAGLTLTTFLGGLRYSGHLSHRIVPFGQLLQGGAHASGALTPGTSGLAGSANGFALAPGGGVDVKLKRKFAVRAVQVDYLLTRINNGVNDHQNNLRIGFGIVYRFGPER
jgi:outer membrane immunogenic protein